MLDLNQVKIIDNHCHPYLKEKEAKDFRSYWSTSLLEGAALNNMNTMTYKMMLKSLKSILDLHASADEETVVARRNDLYNDDPDSYTSMLLNEAGLELLMADIGFPSVGFAGYSIRFDEFAGSMPLPIKPIIRVDNVMLDLINPDLSFKEFLDVFDHTLEKEISTQNPVALKTVIAYLVSLEVKKCTLREIEDSYRKFQADPSDMFEAAPLFFHAVYTAVEKCSKHNLPLQIHTGFGNAPFLNVVKSNPALLFHFLNDPEVHNVKVVLLHSGYPYVRETAYLVNNYPNLWVDISQVTQYTSVGLDSLLTDLLAMAPVNKILYGSDGLGIPELFWWPAIQIRRCLSNILNTFVEQDLVDEHSALEIGKGILRDNALDLYEGLV